VQISHTPLSAQGNVVAGTALARAFTEVQADYYIFYGCCGVVDAGNVGQVFRVASVAYLSLGSVRPRRRFLRLPDETVKLKNKWIVDTGPTEHPPLPTVVLPAGGAGQPGTGKGLHIKDAHVIATDKVVYIAPAATAPSPTASGSSVFEKGEWTYAESLAHHIRSDAGPVLIDMESFGIASTALALGCYLNVLILRVATDALSDKHTQSDPEQRNLLMGGLPALAAVLARIMDP
jgi:nucleoside phosphorylase